MQHVSTREFNQQTSKVQKHAKSAPVIITHRGKPDQVLMSYQQYLDLTNHSSLASLTAADALCSSATVADIDFEPAKVDLDFRPVEF